MKNLIFSKRYLKTKLVLATLIVTVGYHYMSKDKGMSNDTPQQTSTDLNIRTTQTKKTEDVGVTTHTQPIEESEESLFDQEPFGKDARLIPSSWVLEHLREVRGRSPSLNLPRLPKGIFVDSKPIKINIKDLLNAPIFKDIKEHLKSEKFKKQGFLMAFFREFLDYIGVLDEDSNLAWLLVPFAKENLMNRFNSLLEGSKKYCNGFVDYWNSAKGVGSDLLSYLCSFFTINNSSLNGSTHTPVDNLTNQETGAENNTPWSGQRTDNRFVNGLRAGGNCVKAITRAVFNFLCNPFGILDRTEANEKPIMDNNNETNHPNTGVIIENVTESYDENEAYAVNEEISRNATTSNRSNPPQEASNEQRSWFRFFWNGICSFFIPKKQPVSSVVITEITDEDSTNGNTMGDQPDASFNELPKENISEEPIITDPDNNIIETQGNRTSLNSNANLPQKQSSSASKSDSQIVANNRFWLTRTAINFFNYLRSWIPFTSGNKSIKDAEEQKKTEPVQIQDVTTDEDLFYDAISDSSTFIDAKMSPIESEQRPEACVLTSTPETSQDKEFLSAEGDEFLSAEGEEFLSAEDNQNF